jgi:hypothetical protein
MVALRCNEITSIPLEEAVAHTKTVDPDFFMMAKSVIGGLR